MEHKVDRRILKTKKVIQQTFLELLIKEGFDKITIKKISEKGNISRKTFYLHYLDKYDLLDDIINQQLKELNYICEKKKDKGTVDGTIIWFNYFKSNKEFFKALFRSKSTVLFRDKLLNFMIEQLRIKIYENNIIRDDVMIKFLAMGILGILESFVLDEIDGDFKRIAEKVGKILEKNLYN